MEPLSKIPQGIVNDLKLVWRDGKKQTSKSLFLFGHDAYVKVQCQEKSITSKHISVELSSSAVPNLE